MFFTTKLRFSLNSEELFPSWFLDASTWRLVPKVCGHHFGRVCILLLEQKPEFTLLDFVYTFSTSSCTSVLLLFPVCFSLRKQRRLKLSLSASEKKMTAKKRSFSHLKYTHTNCKQPIKHTCQKNGRREKLPGLLQTLFFLFWIKGEFQCTFISLSKKQ